MAHEDVIARLEGAAARIEAICRSVLAKHRRADDPRNAAMRLDILRDAGFLARSLASILPQNLCSSVALKDLRSEIIRPCVTGRYTPEQIQGLLDRSLTVMPAALDRLRRALPTANGAVGVGEPPAGLDRMPGREGKRQRFLHSLNWKQGRTGVSWRLRHQRRTYIITPLERGWALSYAGSYEDPVRSVGRYDGQDMRGARLAIFDILHPE